MVGALRRPAQSFVGASNTTSTPFVPVASRAMSAASAESTSWITRAVCSRRPARRHGEQARRGAAGAASSGTDACTAVGGQDLQPRACALPSLGAVDQSPRGYAVAEPIVRLEPTRVSVEPGGQVTVLVTVFNPGQRRRGVRRRRGLHDPDALGDGVTEHPVGVPAAGGHNGRDVLPSRRAGSAGRLVPVRGQAPLPGRRRTDRRRRGRPRHRRRCPGSRPHSPRSRPRGAGGAATPCR